MFSLLIGVAFSSPVIAQQTLLEQGITYYRAESYEEALKVLKKARKMEPDSSMAAYYLGITYKKLQNYRKAQPNLEAAVTLTPEIPGAVLELAELYYQLNELKKAEKNVKLAEEKGIRPAQTVFLKGLIFLKEGKNPEAIKAFNTAKELDKTLTQTADYQIGLAYLKKKEFSPAKQVFQEVVITDPNSDIAAFADQYIEMMAREEEEAKPFKFSLGLAYQYDDNVLLKPSDATVAANITDENDFREVLTFKGEYGKRYSDRYGIKLQYSLYRSHQHDLGKYNVFSNNFTMAPTYYLGKNMMSFPLTYNRTLVDDRDYLSTAGITPLYNFMIGMTQMGQVFFKFQRKDFLRTPLNADENRDSDNFVVGGGWFRFFNRNKGFFGLRYELNKEDTDGNNWRYIGNKGTISLLVPFKEKFRLNVSSSAFIQDFQETHTIFNKKRKDKIYTISTLLAYKLRKDLELQLQYIHIRDDSNLIIYDYERNIYSLGVEYKF
ncbi:MAG: tetratricopeptide repeat protein [Nitrospirae bacterium]|nr:tetratricopeptide repeat protein [Nitrospirota bacterium]